VVDPIERSETLANLRGLFAELAMSAQRMRWLAQQAEIEGLPDRATVLHSTAEADGGHAQAILDHLAEFDLSLAISSTVEAPQQTPQQAAQKVPVRDAGDLAEALVAAVPPMVCDLLDQLDSFAAAARREGHDQVADSLEVIAGSQRRHLDAFNGVMGDH
jgi:rubrerythrin